VKSAEQGVVLVEVWERGTEVSIHPSRNKFFPVHDHQHKRKLHVLAMDPNRMSMFQAATYARAARGKAPQPISHPKSLTAPVWAQEANLIGYTSASAIQFIGDDISIQGLTSFPSIYYKAGHATIDHLKPGNIGWEYGGMKCLFFGNVPSQLV
jgi:hypothetical protein